jgi:hypothetical protein
MAFLFITFFYILLIQFFIILCVFLLLCIFYYYVICSFLAYVFLLSCMFRSVYSVSLRCSVYCLFTNVYWTPAIGVSGQFSTILPEVYP